MAWQESWARGPHDRGTKHKRHALLTFQSLPITTQMHLKHKVAKIGKKIKEALAYLDQMDDKAEYLKHLAKMVADHQTKILRPEMRFAALEQEQLPEKIKALQKQIINGTEHTAAWPAIIEIWQIFCCFCFFIDFLRPTNRF